MSYVNKLAKGFVRSAINQVGRDGGRVVSNKVYKGKHSKPIYYHDPTNQLSKTGVSSPGAVLEALDSENDINWEIQPGIKRSSMIVTFLKGFFVQIIPLIGSVLYMWKVIQSFIYMNKAIPIYALAENRVKDKRRKEGYRVDGHVIVETDRFRSPLPDERSYYKRKGFIYIIAGIVFWVVLFMVINEPVDPVSIIDNQTETVIPEP